VHRRIALCIVGLLSFVLTAAAPAALAPGAVVGLAGTPHLWIADDQGMLHWGGDTRALTGKYVNWSDRRDVSLVELQALPIGDPWLSAGLLKDGDPIYLVKWETEWEHPTLLHIQSIADVELFGINGSNYGNFVLDKTAWEARYKRSADVLQRGVLASAVPSAQAVAPASSAPAVGGVDFPPALNRDIRITTPSGWFETTLPYFNSVVPGAKTVVTLISDPGARVWMGVAAVLASEYPNATNEDVIIKAVNRDRDRYGWRYLAPDKSRELTEAELLARVEKVTVGDTEASSVVYYTRKYEGGVLFRLTVLKRGNVFWEFYAWTPRSTFSKSLLKVLADVEFLY
jgi:hypothetical protein